MWMQFFSVVVMLVSMLLALTCIGFAAYSSFTLGIHQVDLIFFGIGVCASVVGTFSLRGLYHRRTQRGRNIVTNLILVGISSVISLGLAEFLVAVSRPALTLDRAELFSPGIHRQSAILPFQLKPDYEKTFRSREANRKRLLTINSHGFRGDEFTWNKPAGTYRILLLGDSFAINIAVSDDAVHSAILEKMLNDEFGGLRRYEVINAGYADGYSPDSYIAFMLHEGFALDPDLVIMQYFVANDFKDLLETEVVETRDDMPFRVRSKYRYVDDHGRYRRNVSLKYKLPILRNSHLYVTLYDMLHLERALLQLAGRFNADYFSDNFTWNSLGIRYHHVYERAEARPPILQQMFDQSMDYVRTLDRECKRRGVDFVLFLVPTGVQVARDIWPREFADDWSNPNPQKQIVESLRGSDIPILNPLNFFRESLKEESLYLGKSRDGHWTAAGNKVAANVMYDYLVENYVKMNE
jgi:hypothetical protein